MLFRSKDFYQNEIKNFSIKEKVIFKLTKFVLKNSHALVFSTDWQRQIWAKPYNLNLSKTIIIENFYGEKMPSVLPKEKIFIGGTRKLKWKNLDILEKSFKIAKEKDSSLILDTNNYRYEEFMEKIKKCYAVILVSLGDISPNMILDAIRHNKPFILTKETGLYEKLKDLGLFVDPFDKQDIKNKILMMTDDKIYQNLKENIKKFSYTHSWPEIADEFLKIYKKI